MEKHPREETQAERDAAYRDLAAVIRGKTLRHGSKVVGAAPGSDIVRPNTKIACWKTAEGQEMDLVFIRGTHRRSGPFASISVTKTHDTNVLGKHTEYVSINDGPFTRTDVDGNELGVVRQEPEKRGPIFKGLMDALGVEMIELTIEKNIQEGMDGLPITAEEARSLIADIEGGSFVPRQELHNR